MFSRTLWFTRFTILIPIIGSWVAALLSLALGAYEVIQTVFLIPSGLSDNTLKQLLLNLIESVDLFLLGTAFYLIALGLYELFINEKAHVPGWLVINDLDDLKGNLLSVIVVVLAVQFVAQVLGWKGGIDILYLGASVALVIAATAFFIGKKIKKA
jgi:uncharacterized membrane protein YqhA